LQVTQKAFETCGTPSLITKREAMPEPSQPILIQSLNRNPKKSELEKLVSELRKAVKPSQKFWSRMPYAMCSNTASTDDTIFFDSDSGNFSGNNNKECWNGRDQGAYSKAVVKDGLQNQARNPEVSVDPVTDSSGMPNFVKELVYQLRGIANHLKTDPKGQDADVEWWERARELDRRDRYANEGSGDGHVDDEDFDDGGSGDFDDDGSGEGVDEPAMNVPWMPEENEDTITRAPETPASAGSRRRVISGHLFFFTFSFYFILSMY
jgi:hypothetical protein